MAKKAVNQSAAISFDSTMSRVFEPQRENRNLKLDSQVVAELDSFGSFLEFETGIKPNLDGVVEMILLEELERQKDYQKWKEDQERERQKADREKSGASKNASSKSGQEEKNSTDSAGEILDDSDKEILEKLTETSRK